MSTSTRIVLHIGMHKTGTSAIQAFLHDSYERLAEEGVLYPEAGRLRGSEEEHVSRVSSHYRLAWSLVEKYAQKYKERIFDDPWQILLSELEDNQPSLAIVSSEFFWPATKEEITRIRDYLAGYPVEVILYARNPLSQSLSSYKQGVKTGKISESFHSYCSKRLWRYDYDGIIGRWIEGFGPSNVKLRLYDKVKGNLLYDFAEIAGLGFRPVNEKSSQKNISPSDGVIRLIRLLNICETKWDGKQRRIIRRVRRSIVRRGLVGKLAAQAADMVMRRPLLRQEDVVWFRETTAEMLGRFLEKHVPPEDHRFFVI